MIQLFSRHGIGLLHHLRRMLLRCSLQRCFSLSSLEVPPHRVEVWNLTFALLFFSPSFVYFLVVVRLSPMGTSWCCSIAVFSVVAILVNETGSTRTSMVKFRSIPEMPLCSASSQFWSLTAAKLSSKKIRCNILFIFLILNRGDRGKTSKGF